LDFVATAIIVRGMALLAGTHFPDKQKIQPSCHFSRKSFYISDSYACKIYLYILQICNLKRLFEHINPAKHMGTGRTIGKETYPHRG
jgi:hypothetical protein